MADDTVPPRQADPQDAWRLIEDLLGTINDQRSRGGMGYSLAVDAGYREKRDALLSWLREAGGDWLAHLAGLCFPTRLADIVNDDEGYVRSYWKHDTPVFLGAMEQAFGPFAAHRTEPAPAENPARAAFHARFIAAWKLAPQRAGGWPTREDVASHYGDRGISPKTLAKYLRLHGQPEGYDFARQRRSPAA